MRVSSTLVRVARGGAVLGQVDLDRGAFSCALGRNTLSVATNIWSGPDATDGNARNGQLVAVAI